MSDEKRSTRSNPNNMSDPKDKSSAEEPALVIPSGLDPKIMDYITAAIGKELQALKREVQTNNLLLTEIKADVTEIKRSLSDCSERIDTISNNFLPSLAKHVTDISVALAERVLDMDVHSRKWSLVLYGIKGEAGEAETTTRDKCRKLASKIGVPNASSMNFAACHRLNHNAPDAGIIARFTDLADREAWLSKAKNLSSVDTALKLSPDLPPVLRKQKNELLKRRGEMGEAEKRNTRLRYIPHWPYVELVYKDKSNAPIRPPYTKEQILRDILGFSPNIAFSFAG